MPAADCLQSSPYPDPILPDGAVLEERARRLGELQRIVLVGIVIRGGVVVVELTASIQLGSSALLADGIASAVDIVSSVALLIAFRLAVRPPDEDHPFGHGRYEPLAGLQIGLLIAAAGTMLLLQLLLGRDLAAFEPEPGLFLVPAAAAVALMGTGLALRRSGRANRSSAVRAEAKHYLVDAATSLAAAVTLVAGQLFPESAALWDRGGALVLALLVVVAGLSAAQENLHQLMDRAPSDRFFDRVRNAARSVDGVREVEKIRIQAAGPDAHVDIDIEVDPTITVERSHRIAQRVRAAVQSDWAMVREVVVHVEPYYADDH